MRETFTDRLLAAVIAPQVIESMTRVWISFRPSLASAGKRVLSYPDHRGRSELGTIIEATSERVIVTYDRYGTVCLKATGKLMDKAGTSEDINLIER